MREIQRCNIEKNPSMAREDIACWKFWTSVSTEMARESTKMTRVFTEMTRVVTGYLII